MISAHLAAGQTYVIDLNTNRVVASVTDTPGAEGVEYVPELKRFYTSNAGDNIIGVVGPKQMKVIKKLKTEAKPDGSAYAAPFHSPAYVGDSSPFIMQSCLTSRMRCRIRPARQSSFTRPNASGDSCRLRRERPQVGRDAPCVQMAGRTASMQRTGFSHDGAMSCRRESRPSRWSAGCDQRMWRWDQGQNQMCDVGFVFTRSSLGVLRLQSDLVGHSGRSWRKERSKHWRARQCQASRSTPGLITRTSETRSHEAGIPGPLLVFLDGALGTRRGELGALRWSDCNFDSMSFSVQHSYYWRRGGHLKSTKTEASAKVLPMHPVLKDALLEWKLQNEYNGPGDFVFPSHRHKGKKPLDLAAVLKRKIQPAFAAVGITGVGWHTFRHTVGTILAEMGEHQLTIRDYLRTAICMSRTSTSKRHRSRSAWHRGNS